MKQINLQWKKHLHFQKNTCNNYLFNINKKFMNSKQKLMENKRLKEIVDFLKNTT